MARDGKGEGNYRGPGSKDDDKVGFVVLQESFLEDYGHVLRFWENVTGYRAPPHVVSGRINQAFVEWLMGVPPGHVTSVVSWSQSMRMFGNGVVPRQAALAISQLL